MDLKTLASAVNQIAEERGIEPKDVLVSIEEEKKKLLLGEKRLEDKKSALLEKLEDRIIDDADFTERYEAIKKELESIHDRMAQLASKGENVDAKKFA